MFAVGDCQRVAMGTLMTSAFAVRKARLTPHWGRELRSCATARTAPARTTNEVFMVKVGELVLA